MIRYHSYRVVRGYNTGLLLDRHPNGLEVYIKNHGMVGKVAFKTALESVISHLHGLGWAHNDIKPSNILVSEIGKPILID
ncbi:hypothetical protein N7495_003668 [Penicillium taxi]|uniref:uncharacterized protein n=1 Tax=Penicillium taxi TaxID=168475 RepID=UPI002544DC2E|nr:uncharacterized protein N7495_003668 [Penicillium taxi]KAJ5898924.1 hypothetical protein N7495_003668 [Penicillium taxi]